MLFLCNTEKIRHWLSSKALTGIIKELQSSLKSLVRGVVLHQIKVKAAKDKTLVSKEALRQCTVLAKAAVIRKFPSQHKTNAAFGMAQLLLRDEEYGWFKLFLVLKAFLIGGLREKLNQYLQ
ncbi:hypothetical protein AAFF_G00354600 [Aldrovandia affinis]|uniref:Uncharacterized protein n=1 Tax=Aldrovandia affinis TaxID=143900 RepID=A0AAD7WNJ0_9TELE|nr:hypothetical protein AAFF_G00354600 [Aldrovandia affinis]